MNTARTLLDRSAVGFFVGAVLLTSCMAGAAETEDKTAVSSTSTIAIGSGGATEFRITAEIVARQLEAAGFTVKRLPNSTRSLSAREALLAHSVDLVVDDLSGVRASLGLSDKKDEAAVQNALQKSRLVMSGDLGFQTGFVVAVRPRWSLEKSVRSLDDLKRVGSFRAAFSPDFVSRADGSTRLRDIYGASAGRTETVGRAMALSALVSGRADIVDLRRLDPEASGKELVVLADERHAFPASAAVIIARDDVRRDGSPVWPVIEALENQIPASVMQRLTELVDTNHSSVSEAADIFIGSLHWKRIEQQKAPDYQLPPSPSSDAQHRGAWRQLRSLTVQHVRLIALMLLLAFGLGLPLGYGSAKRSSVGTSVLAFSLVFETIPGLALLCLFLPHLGPGTRSVVLAGSLACAAPIVIAATRAFSSVPPTLVSLGRSWGLSRRQIFLNIEWPLASPTLFAGARRSAVTAAGLATLAGIVGGGGYGTLIAVGVALGNPGIVLRGATPAILVAFLLRWVIEALDLLLVSTAARALSEKA